ncbi:hypothetical protein M8C21_011449, partial [Ambrosia artemisiifolia]
FKRSIIPSSKIEASFQVQRSKHPTSYLSFLGPKLLLQSSLITELVMSFSSSSVSSRRFDMPDELCRCGAPTCYRISRTRENPGRRFLCCVSSSSTNHNRYCINEQKGKCGWIKWADNLDCPRCERLIPALVRSLNDKEEEAKAKTKEVWKLKIAIGILVLSFVV